jgi:regulator of Ty1 transposition protein 103
MESFTPVGSPQQAPAPRNDPVPSIRDDEMPQPVAHPVVPETAPAPAHHTTQPEFATAIGEPNQHPAADLLKSLQHARPGAEGGVYGQQAYENAHKKRKMSRNAADDDFAAFAGDRDMAGIDDNFAELI